ncbi:hypothetical protein, partial [Rhodopirellula europaea]|uniref:hypothetical protein n=1 Tax=Rhodopirellula europaea TaxID=1263866 RepID=UPI001F2AB056
PISKFDDFRSGLFDHDSGSCRDVNFTPLSLEDCSKIVHRVFAASSACIAHDSNGEPLAFDAAEFVKSFATIPSAHATLSNVAGLFDSLQCFACADQNGAFLELTFFPADLAPSDDPLVHVVRFLNSLCGGTSVSEYFVRYENASWQFGTTGPNTGVIFTRSQVATVA